MHNPVLARDWHKQNKCCAGILIYLVRIQPLKETWGPTSSVTATHTELGLLRGKTHHKPWAVAISLGRATSSAMRLGLANMCLSPQAAVSTPLRHTGELLLCSDGIAWTGKQKGHQEKSPHHTRGLQKLDSFISVSWRWPKEGRTEGADGWRGSATKANGQCWLKNKGIIVGHK